MKDLPEKDNDKPDKNNPKPAPEASGTEVGAAPGAHQASHPEQVNDPRSIAEIILTEDGVALKAVAILAVPLAFLTAMVAIVVFGSDSFTFDATTQSLTAAFLTLLTAASSTLLTIRSMRRRSRRSTEDE